jgi:hypothetical protein
MKKVFIVMIAVVFCLSFVGIVAAAEVVKKPGTTMQQVPGTTQPVPIFMCPTGWTKKPNAFACVPSKPAPINCPAGYQYYEKLACSASTFFGGCQVEGCEVGCFKPPEPPK